MFHIAWKAQAAVGMLDKNFFDQCQDWEQSSPKYHALVTAVPWDAGHWRDFRNWMPRIFSCPSCFPEGSQSSQNLSVPEQTWKWEPLSSKTNHPNWKAHSHFLEPLMTVGSCPTYGGRNATQTSLENLGRLTMLGTLNSPVCSHLFSRHIST